MKKENKAQIVIDKIISWGIAIFVLILMVSLAFILKNKGVNIIDYTKSLKFWK